MWKNILLFLSLSGLVGHHASPITKLYHHVDQKMSWTDAQRYCREQFHDLATIDNLEDLERLQASRRGSDYDIDTAWIGLYDDRTRWQWSYGNQDYKMGQDYDNWRQTEPNNRAGVENYYDDLNCEELHYVACQELQKLRSTFKLKVSTKADMADPEVRRQFLEQLSAKMAKEGVTGVQLHLVVKDGQDQQSEK
ncbi:unnamed protein product [Gadus morhua 'NCC']